MEKYSEFEIGFWHPFGDHASEKPGDIITRKQGEINKNGWTLWSFQRRTRETMGAWFKEIKNANSVLVLTAVFQQSLSMLI